MYKMSGQSRIINCDEVLRVRRFASTPGSDTIYIDGKPIARDAFEFELSCNVQPLSGKDLLLVPEGDRYTSSLWIWTHQADPALQASDLVHRDGRWYQVQSSEDWGSYSRCRIMQVDVGPNAPIGTQSCDPDEDDARLMLA